MGTIDKRPDGVEAPRADQHDLDSYPRAEADLSRLQVPILLHGSNPHERLYLAAMDGTGNSMFKDDPVNWSAVAKINSQIDSLRKQGITNVAGGYVEGTFTQDNPAKRIVDGFAGNTFERRVETAYYQFCVQAKKWIDEDPDAQIRVAGVGFSRGSEEVAALHRMIDERGIRDPVDAKVARDKENPVAHVEYSGPPLVPPGKILQAALLFDPVSTGVTEHDRRLPPSVVSALQITAEDERRNLFISDDLLKPGFSERDRFLNVTVGGCHSDIGDAYSLNGLGVRSFNLGADFVNGLSDTPILQKRAVPDDPALSVVHRSDQHMHGLYRTSTFRDGVRDHRDDVAPAALCRNGSPRDCQIKEPISPDLDAPLERRAVPIGPVTRSVSPSSSRERDPAPTDRALTDLSSQTRIGTNDAIDRLYAASLTGDAGAWRQASQSAANQFMASPSGQSWQGEVRGLEQTQMQDRQVAADLAQQRAAQQASQQVSQQNPHVMRM